MTDEWTSVSPLRNLPGNMLATMVADQSPGNAHLLVTGQLETLATLAPVDEHTGAEGMQLALSGYLAGLAAAAIVADAACGTRHWTSARDFALGGREVTFLEPETVILGTLALAMTAVGRALEVEPVWRAPFPAAPEGHREVVELIQRSLAQATQARMTQVANHADEVNGV